MALPLLEGRGQLLIEALEGGAKPPLELLLEPARVAFHDTVEGPDRRPTVPIVAAQLGNDAGAVGAAALALEELGRLP